MKKTAKSSKTIRANKRKASLKAKHRRQRDASRTLNCRGVAAPSWPQGSALQPGWQGPALAPSENPGTRRGYHCRGQPGSFEGELFSST